MVTNGGNGNGNGHGAEHHRLPRRSMADITQLFMSGARTRAAALSQRTAPAAQRAESQKQVDLERELLGITPPPTPQLSPAAPPSDAPEQADAVSPPAAGVAYMIPACSGPDLILTARRWAKARGISMGLISLEPHAVRILHIDGRHKPAIVRAVPILADGLLDVQLARVLYYSMRGAIEQWVIAAAEAEHDLAAPLQAVADEHVLVCGMHNDGLIAAYRILKAHEAGAAAGIRLLVEAPTASLAGQVHQRLNSVTKEFLHQELAFDHIDPCAVAEIGCVATLNTDRADRDQLTAIGAALTEFFSQMPEDEERFEATAARADDLPPEVVRVLRAPAAQPTATAEPADSSDIQSVLDPQERAALEHDWLDETITRAAPPAPEVPVLAPAAQCPPDPAPPDARPAPKSANGHGRTPAQPAAPADLLQAGDGALHIVEVPHEMTPATQWSAVEESIPALLPEALLLEARPPWDTAALALDAQQRLHLWVLAGTVDPFAWAAIRAWANAHRALVALTHRAVRIDTAAPVQVHVVLPVEAPASATQQPWPTDVQWYRLRKVRWAQRTGLTVVPS